MSPFWKVERSSLLLEVGSNVLNGENIILTGTQAPYWMHIILFSESNGTNKGSGF